MTQHLKETAVEALAHARGDLLEEPEHAHLAACAECRGRVATTRVMSNDTALALREALPPMGGLEELIAGALAKVSDPVVRPSLRALRRAGLGAAVATLLLGSLSAAASPPTLSGVFSVLRDALAVAGALDRIVSVALPGGWSLVMLAGFFLLIVVALPLRRLVARPSTPGPGGAGAVMAVMAALLCLAPHGGAARALDLEGEWPEAERSVTVSVQQAPLGEVLQRSAAAAGLGYAATLPEPLSTRQVTLEVRDASLSDVLEALLGDAPVVARRTSSMLVLRVVDDEAPGDEAPPGADAPPSLAAPPGLAGAAANTPTPPPAPPSYQAGPAPERVTFGGDVHIMPGERVREVVSMGGDVIVEGEVLGDVVTMGGDLVIKRGGVVRGATVTMGGDVTVEPGGQRLGEHGAAGSIFSAGRHHAKRGRVHDDDAGSGHHRGVRIGGWLEDALGSAARHALLLLLGIILLGVAPARFDALKRTIARSPVRSGGIGVLGFIGVVVLVVVLTLTLIGIPAAIVVGLGAFLGTYVGLVASAAVVGAVLPVSRLAGRPILQLAVGLGLFYLVSLLPLVGGLFIGVAAALGFGALLMTRFGPKAYGEA